MFSNCPTSTKNIIVMELRSTWNFGIFTGNKALFNILTILHNIVVPFARASFVYRLKGAAIFRNIEVVEQSGAGLRFPNIRGIKPC